MNVNHDGDFPLRYNAHQSQLLTRPVSGMAAKAGFTITLDDGERARCDTGNA